MSSEIWNLNTLCRCCHADGYFTSLSLTHQDQEGVEYVYEVMLKEALGITISTPPLDASYSICNQCIDKLIDASNFRKQVLACEEKFTIYCTNEQFVRTSDAIKIEEEKDDDDDNVDDFDHDDYIQPHTDIKEEFTIEVDIKHPIEKEEERNAEKEKEENTVIETETSNNKKNRRNLKNSKKSNQGNCRSTIKRDRSVIVQVETENGVQYSCKTCGGCYQTEKDINRHINDKHSTPHKCEVCPKQFKNRQTYLRHIKLHTGNTYQCPHCEKKFIEKNMFNNHFNTHTKEKKFICDICQKEFKYKGTLKKHLQLHAGTLKKLLCDLCGGSFNDRTNLNIHISTVHEKLRPFTCAMCAKNFSTKNHLRKHIKYYHNSSGGRIKFHCTICDRRIACPKTFKIHMMRHDNKFMCKFCKVIFSDKGHLSDHVKEKHSRNHPCHLCTKTFYSKHSLNRHIDSHNGIKRFECEICGIKFNQKVMLKRHTFRLHNPDFAYRNVGPKAKCEICKKSFRNIVSHMESHTNRKYSCDICGKTYPKTNALNRHKESKHFGKSFDCEICNKKYLQKAKLNTHKLKVHKIKIEKDSLSNIS